MNYSDFKHIEVKDFFEIKDQDYYIYLYFTDCPHCNAIKDKVLNFVSSHPELNFYFINMDGDKDSDLFFNTQNNDNLSRNAFIKQFTAHSLNKTTLKEVDYYYVPSLYHIKNHILVDIKVTEITILGELNAIK